MLGAITQLLPGPFTAPSIDWLALGPEVVLLVLFVVLILLDAVKLGK